MARPRLPKRPPTPSESQDETESSENEDSEEDEPGEDEELMLPVGAEAEVRSDEPGFVGSFYEVTITGHLAHSPGGRGYTVVYSTLVADDGSPLDEAAAAADVRPRPPREGRTRERGFAVHEAVEAFHNEGWWAGVVSAAPPPVAGAPRVYEVAFPTSRETMEFEETALRPHSVFQAGRWVPAAEVEDASPLFHEGIQVEVSQSTKSFGESWSPASVLKVIGATNFLVQYTHREDSELATEIIDSQYIRPARTHTRMDSRYRVSRSSHVELMHEGSWWPGVIREVLGSGIDKKYVVKLKRYETDMDDVECLDALIVRSTQLRPHFDWDGKKWVRRLKEEFVNVTKLSSRKRPSSSAMSLYKEVGEIGDKHGSYREKKLKNTDVVSEPTSPPFSVCNDNYGITHKSSSYPDETMKEGNAVVALGSQLEPPALPPMTGFAHLSDSSHAQSSHLEQDSSQKIITPSALVPQSRQLQASMLGTFGEPGPFLQGPLSGMQLLNPHTQKEGTTAKSIEEARNTVSMSEDPANLKNSVDDVEIGCNVTSGHGMISEINTVNCVNLILTTPNDIGGSQDGRSAMDDQVSGSLAIEHLPFVKTSPIWPQIEAMEIFSKGLQRPHANQYRQHGSEFHEGMTLGLMLSFANLAESINSLDVKDDIEGLFKGKMQGLSSLEANGFDVRALRSRLEALLCRKNRHHAVLRDDAMKTLEEKIARSESDDRELGVRMRVLAMALHHVEVFARLMRYIMRSAVTKKMNYSMEITRLKAEADKLERTYVSTAAAPR